MNTTTHSVISRHHPKPFVRIVSKIKRDSLGVKTRGEVEKAEINNLYSAMLKKVGCLFPFDPHAMLFNRIDDLFHDGDLTREKFIKMFCCDYGNAQRHGEK